MIKKENVEDQLDQVNGGSDSPTIENDQQAAKFKMTSDTTEESTNPIFTNFVPFK